MHPSQLATTHPLALNSFQHPLRLVRSTLKHNSTNLQTSSTAQLVIDFQDCQDVNKSTPGAWVVSTTVVQFPHKESAAGSNPALPTTVRSYMFNHRTSMQFHNKSLKTFIEHDFYSTSAHFGLVDSTPLIVPGPALRRTHLIATTTRVSGISGSTYVELNPSVYRNIAPTAERTLTRNSRFLNRNILDCPISRMVDFDATGAITSTDGSVFTQLLSTQSNAFTSTKSIIYTAALRPISLAATLATYKDILARTINASITFDDPISIIDSPRASKWHNDFTQQRLSTGSSPRSFMHCHLITATHSSNIEHFKAYYYNSGGGHMISFHLIYK